jgi:hypothetical protein
MYVNIPLLSTISKRHDEFYSRFCARSDFSHVKRLMW